MDTPVDAATFSRLMRDLENEPRLAIAVSGGGDSLALMWLADRWRTALTPPRPHIDVLTVNHRLRPDADKDVQIVERHAATLNMPCHVLPWDTRRPDSPGRVMQAAARAHRYRLLTQWCRDHAVPVLLLAHHLDDQAETVLLRLARGSGVTGLAAMSRDSRRGGIRLCRPLLDIPRARLHATCRRAGLSWAEDPSNHDPAYARARIRQLAPALAAEGLTPERLAATARRMARANQALETMTIRCLREGVRLEEAGYATLDPAILTAAPEDIALRALARTIQTVGGGQWPPRLAALENILAALGEDRLAGGRTLGGCLISPHNDVIRITREAHALRQSAPVALAPDSDGIRAGICAKIWDGRFSVTLAGGPPDSGVVRALGERHCQMAPQYPVPHSARAALPALWNGAEILAVPHLGLSCPGFEATLLRPPGLEAPLVSPPENPYLPPVTGAVGEAPGTKRHFAGDALR